MSRIAVVGAGISGIACATELANAGHKVVVLDRGVRLGGRMATQSLRLEGKWQGHLIDVGAAYPTTSHPDFAKLMKVWAKKGLAHEWTNTFHVAQGTTLGETKTGPMRWACSGGLRALVEDLADQLPADRVELSHPVDIESIVPSDHGVTIDGNSFDAVALAMPDPQAKRLLDAAFKSSHNALRGVAWEAILVMAAAYEKRTWKEIDGVFVNDSADLTFIADDGRRRGDDAPVLVAHSTGMLAQHHLENSDAAAPAMLKAMHAVMGIKADPVWTTVKRWTYARPLAARAEQFHFDLETRVGLCGDAWGGGEAGPRIENAWLSGRALGAHMAQAVASA